MNDVVTVENTSLYHNSQATIIIIIMYPLVGGISTTLINIKLSWDDCSQYGNAKKLPNHQPCALWSSNMASWNIAELHGGFNRKIIEKWSIFQPAMFDDTGG